MAEHRLSTQILLRYDTYTRWMNSDVILQQGETAIAAFPDTNPNNPPKAIGIKIGDGTHYFDELPWIQAVAADVYEWAKNPTKPVYTANEISGLAEYIAAHTSGGGGGGGESSNSYRIIYDSVSDKYILQQWNDTTGEWENTASEINLHDILNRIDTIERWANGATTNLGNLYDPISSIVYDEVIKYINKLDVNDMAVAHQFVTSVTEVDGKIQITRSIIRASDITDGVLPTTNGGTGLSYLDENEIMVGSNNGTITTRTFVTTIDPLDRTSFATVGAIIDYVAQMTAGLTGAMHFVGEATIPIPVNSHVDPQIMGYTFRDAQMGDVILANNAQELVWTGSEWRLLGDEGSYAIKGSIVNADIAENANISQSKIDGLSSALENKVDKVEGKQLSTNDYTTEEKTKLEEIEEGAQVNLIEHILVNDVETLPNNEKTINLQIPVLTEEQINKINVAEANVIEHVFVNGTEVNPSVINLQPKSVNITHVMTDEEVEKLTNIEAGAQVNKVETISFNGGDPITANTETKNIDITIDASALHLTVLEGARYPSGNNSYTAIEKDQTGKILELSKVAATGNIDDLVQTTGYIILNCGSSTEVI